MAYPHPTPQPNTFAPATSPPNCSPGFPLPDGWEVIADIRGQFAKTLIFSRNKKRSYVRQWATNVQPNTPAQLAWRAAMRTTVAGYLALAPVDRRTWNTSAPQFTKYHPPGPRGRLTGYLLYLRTNLPRAHASLPLLTLPPV